MKKKAIKLFLLSLLLMVFFALLTFPKFLLFDRLLSQRGFYLTAEKVKEGLLGFELSRGSLYGRDGRLLTFDFMSVEIKPFYVAVGLECGGGRLVVKRYLDGLRVQARRFGCLEGLGSLSADLDVRKDIRGAISLYDLRVQGLEVERLEVNFKGRTFEAKAKAMGFELIGEGQVVPNPKDPMSSKINGQVVGGGLRLVISGSLYNLRVSR